MGARGIGRREAAIALGERNPKVESGGRAKRAWNRKAARTDRATGGSEPLAGGRCH